MNQDSSNEKYNVKSVERCLSLLDLAANSDDIITVQTVMNSLGLNTNMAYRLLTTLVSSGYLAKDEKTSTYTVTLKVTRLFRKALSSIELRKTALPYMEMLWNQYPQANVNLAVLYNDEVIQTDRIDSQTVPRTYFTPGKSVPLHASGMGKVLLSELDDSVVSDLIEKAGGFKQYTPYTITDMDVFLRTLESVRKDGFATDREELILKDNCNACPIRDGDGKIVAAVSMSAFDNFISKEVMESAIPNVCEIARKISYMLGYQL